MDSTFLRMLAVPSKIDFCKVSTLYDIPNFSKLYSKSFGMGPNAIWVLTLYLITDIDKVFND